MKIIFNLISLEIQNFKKKEVKDMRLSLQISEDEKEVRKYLEKNNWLCVMPLKILGFTKGVSDFLVFKKGILLAIEIKKAQLSKDQERFKTVLENNGGIYIAGTNSNEIISKISELEKQRISFKENML